MSALWVIGVALVVLLVIVVVAGWFASERLLRVSEESYAVTLDVVALTATDITFPLSLETSRPGVYGITWPDGYAVVGDVVTQDSTTVTRRLIKVTHPLGPGCRVRWNIFVHAGNPFDALGLRYEDMDISSELGPLPAWFVPGSRTTWMLLVHGFRANREEGLRILPVLAEMGFPVLLLSYRNDRGAPPSPDGFYHLGDTEWRDLEAGVKTALAHGAHDVILYGWSMGGCMIEAFLHRSADTSPTRAVILDSPILDWLKSLDAQVRRLHMPRWFTFVLAWFVNCKAQISFAALNQLHRSPERTVPTLLFHGTADAMVPIVSSDRLAASRPDLIVYRRVDGADHTQSWNVNPAEYEHALRVFLSETTHTTHVG